MPCTDMSWGALVEGEVIVDVVLVVYHDRGEVGVVREGGDTGAPSEEPAGEAGDTSTLQEGLKTPTIRQFNHYSILTNDVTYLQ